MINQLIRSGCAPLAYRSINLMRQIIDQDNVEASHSATIELGSEPRDPMCINRIEIFSPFGRMLEPNVSLEEIHEIILNYSSFSNRSISLLLNSALGLTSISFGTALHDFKSRSKKNFVREINELDKNQYHLLWYLTVAGLYSCVDELIETTLNDLHMEMKCGPQAQTILHFAVVGGHVEDIRRIIEKLTDINQCDRFGRTVLHYLVLCGNRHENHLEIAKLLIDHQVSPKYVAKS